MRSLIELDFGIDPALGFGLDPVLSNALSKVKIGALHLMESAIPEHCGVNIEKANVISILTKGALVRNSVVTFPLEQFGNDLSRDILSNIVASVEWYRKGLVDSCPNRLLTLLRRGLFEVNVNPGRLVRVGKAGDEG